jgi:hypothetical protein
MVLGFELRASTLARRVLYASAIPPAPFLIFVLLNYHKGDLGFINLIALNYAPLEKARQMIDFPVHILCFFFIMYIYFTKYWVSLWHFQTHT